MDRRRFLASLSALGLAACDDGPRGAASLRPISGRLLGPSFAIGHALKDGGLPEPGETLRQPVVIAGGGIAGLSAAWKLRKVGFGDFTLFELEDRPGGNARFGENTVSAFPWGAHYLPLPTQEARAVRELLSDLGVLQGDPFVASPRYDERYLVHTPQDRMYRNGIWQDGLLPRIGADPRDLEQLKRFDDLVTKYRERRDRQGRRAFAIPMALSSPDAELHLLDHMSMRDFLLGHGLDSPALHWYVDYACRDDFGLHSANTSAWAGLHYWACRNATAKDADSGAVLTWPEGIGWIVRRLAPMLAGHIRSQALVWRIEETARSVRADIYLHRERRSVRVECEHLIWASPVFQLPRVLPSADPALVQASRAWSYSPWIVANLTLEELPRHTIGAPLSWDNVFYDSPSLGYVVATHQQLRLWSRGTVLTWFLPLVQDDAAAGRKQLLEAPWQVWSEMALADIGRAHAEIRDITASVDVFRWGHAMVRPVQGFIWGQARQLLTRPRARLHLAHSDLSGFSLFEEAQYRGVTAAERVLAALGVRFSSSIV